MVNFSKRGSWCVHVPAAHEDVVGPHHGQGQQMVQPIRLKVAHVPQDELPPRLPVLVALPVTPKRLRLLGRGPVLLDEILDVERRHLSRV